MLDIHSKPLDGKKISDLTFLERALLFAELSNIAYEPLDDVLKMATALGFTTVEFYQNDDAEAYRLQTRDDLVIVCRGTEANENDIWTDMRVWPTKTPWGRVHTGFHEEVTDLWANICEDLKRSTNRDKNFYITGHSLGAGMATLMTRRCESEDALPNPVELFTYGSPRAGWRQYIDTITTVHHRFVNNNDIICRLPTAFMGYKHHGVEHYITYKGVIVKDSTGLGRIWDGIKGFGKALLKLRFDLITDHLMQHYIDNIRKNL